jgi:hypothetical protein
MVMTALAKSPFLVTEQAVVMIAINEEANLVPPVIDWVTPVGAVLPTDSLVVDITDDESLGHVTIVASYNGGAYKELVYDGFVFGPLYSGSSTGVIVDGTRFTLVHDSEWYDDVTIQVTAEDNAGNQTVGPRSFTVPAGAGVPILVQGGAAPVVSFVTPSGDVPSADPITVDVTDDGSLSNIIIFADYSGLQEIIYDGTTFGTNYNAASTATPISGGTRFTMRHDTGWYQDLSIRVIALDDAAQVTDDSEAYTIPDGPGLPGSGAVIPDLVPPVIDQVDPATLTSLLAIDPVTFRVTDGSGSLLVVFISVFFPDTGEHEVIYNGDQFSPRYKSLSSKTPVADGDVWRVRRVSGWPTPPTIQVKAYDPTGNTAVLTIS